MRVQTIALGMAAAMLAACASTNERGQSQTKDAQPHTQDELVETVCYTEPGKPTNTNPTAPDAEAKEQKKRPSGKNKCDADNVLSVIFKDGVLTGVGGGDEIGAGVERNNKRVNKDKAYCWVATDENGAPSNEKFAILFSPEDKPKAQKSWIKVKIRNDLQSGIEYKYTIWASSADNCSIMDPMFLIN